MTDQNKLEGKYQAKASSIVVTPNRFGTECAAIEFTICEGSQAGRTVSAEYEFSDQRYEGTIAVLEKLGWQRTGLSPEILRAECTRQVTINVRYNESKKLDRNGKPYVNQYVDVDAAHVPLEGNALSTLEQRLRQLGKMGAAPIAPPTSKPAASGKVGGEDDIPF